MENDGEPEAYYEATDGSKMSCSLRQAQLWLLKGYFTSSSRFALRGRDGKEEWRAVGEWMERNGREMPFTEWMSSEEEKKEKEEELGRLREEMDKIRQRKEHLQRVLLDARERRVNVQKELHRIAQKFPDALPSKQFLASQKVASNGVANGSPASGPSQSPSPPPPALPQITPKPGVDPFALLRGCTGARRKLDGDVVGRFSQLRIRFDRCDKKRLVQQTSDVFEKNTERNVRMCALCKVKIVSTNNLMEHICGSKHVYAMAGSVCADAFDFWWKAVEAVTTAASNPGYGPGPGFDVSRISGFGTKPTQGFGNSGFGSQPNNGFGARPEPASSSRAEPAKRSAQGATAVAPANLPGLDILRREERVTDPCANPKGELAKMMEIFNKCSKKSLDNDPYTMGFFQKPLLCLICNRCAIDKASNLVTHITGTGHVDTIGEEKIAVSQSAIDFWMKAVQRASK